MVIVEQATFKRNPTLYDLILYKQNCSYIDERKTWALISHK